jgi:hypothetical protein
LIQPISNRSSRQVEAMTQKADITVEQVILAGTPWKVEA